MRPVSTGRLGVGCGSADASGTRAAEGTELAESVGSGCTAAGLGAPPERLSAGLQARTVQETVASRKVLRLTSNPIPRVLVLDRQRCCWWFPWVESHVDENVVDNRSSFDFSRTSLNRNVVSC